MITNRWNFILGLGLTLVFSGTIAHMPVGFSWDRVFNAVIMLYGCWLLATSIKSAPEDD